MDFALIDRPGKDQLVSWIGDKTLNLKRIYRASQHGFSAADFHKRCDKKGATVVVVHGNNMVFGGYTKESWDISGQYKSDQSSFLFQIRDLSGNNYVKQEFKYQNNVEICCAADIGPTFCYNKNAEFSVFPKGFTNRVIYVDEYGGYFQQGYGYSTHFAGGTGTRNISEAEVYQVVKTASCAGRTNEEEPWRKMVQSWDEKEHDKIRDEIGAFSPPEEIGINHVNILLLGPIDSGKSSFFNTINSVYRGHVTAQAPIGTGPKGITTKFRKYEIRNRTGTGERVLNLRLCDTPGIGEDHGLDILNIPYLLEGHIADRFQFNPVAPVTADTQGFVDRPGFGERMHAIALALTANDISSISKKVIETLLSVKTQAYVRGLPLLVILTHCETIMEEPGKLDTIFSSDAVYSTVQDVASMLGVPKGHVLPVVNYENQSELDIHRDLLALLAVRQILRSADGYFDDQVDAGNWQERPEQKKDNKSKAETLDQPN